LTPVWFNCGRGVWDTGLIELAIRGDLWPTPARYEVVTEPRPGGVAVVHGEIALEKAPDIPDGTVIIHGGDESRAWVPPPLVNGRWWGQHAMPRHNFQPSRTVVPAYPPDTRELMRGVARLPLAERALWGFAGQAANPSRRSLLAAVEGRVDGLLAVSGGFSQGMPREEYVRFMCDVAIVPSPAGGVDPEGFRLYEGLEAGCLPVSQRTMPDWDDPIDWWRWTLGEPAPWPVVDRWAEFPVLLDSYALHPAILQRDANVAGAWWQGYKRRWAWNLADDVAAVGGGRAMHPGLGSVVTVVVSSSPITGHPSTDLIADTIRAVRAYPELSECEVLICCDGWTPDAPCSESAYEEYRRRLIEMCRWEPEFRGCLPIVHAEHAHQAEMTRRALKLVRTPLVFFVEHDTLPHGKIDFAGIARVLTETDEADLVRLNIWHAILPEHAHLYPDGDAVREVCGVPLVRTVDWSQRPHLVRTEKLVEWLDAYVEPGKAIWIEHAFYGIAIHNWETFRMAVYAPPGDQVRSLHSDGRRWRCA
jgi:hypothetical protein